MQHRISIIIPCYNEEKIVGQVIKDLQTYTSQKGLITELVVVDDGSTDGSARIIAEHGVTIVRHRVQMGYGTAIKSGAAAARYEWLLLYDADGQHTTGNLDAVLAAEGDYDMVVGARTGWKGPAIRQPGKRIIKWVAEYLSGTKIPDVNSGLRLVRKEVFMKFRHMYPEGFSLSTTLTIAALKDHFKVVFVPITITKRTGRSTVKVQDAFTTLLLISRLITVFSPLRLFTRIASGLLIIGLISVIRDLVTHDVREITIFFLMTSIIIFAFGLIADQIAELRRHL